MRQIIKIVIDTDEDRGAELRDEVAELVGDEAVNVDIVADEQLFAVTLVETTERFPVRVHVNARSGQEAMDLIEEEAHGSYVVVEAREVQP